MWARPGALRVRLPGARVHVSCDLLRGRAWCEQKEPSWELYAIQRTTCQMLQDRGYALPPEDTDDFTYDSFLQRWNGKKHKDLTILGE